MSLEEVWQNQSVYQWVQWITSTAPEAEVPKIDWPIEVLPGTKNNDWDLEPGISSWSQPVGTLKDILKKRCNLRDVLSFYPYCWTDGMKEFYNGGAHIEC